ELLRNACALLMPIQWEEPFGLVMIEAMACGTPVIGFRRGSVPEIIENGSNGFVCDNVDEMASAVLKIHEIDRRRCRQTVEKKFSSDVIVDHYENLYYSLIGPLR
ncbi:MAG: glycosyltransferase family 4 protein, partial [Candidatus Omnitrophica bacterium CG07_land_8_20_14_0_80_50_8]